MTSSGDLNLKTIDGPGPVHIDLVASAHGLDTGAYTFPYVAGWASEVPGVEIDQVVRGTANRVLAAAKVVLAGTEYLLEQTGEGQVRQQNLTLPADTAAPTAPRRC